jgi:hypothetical protein
MKAKNKIRRGYVQIILLTILFILVCALALMFLKSYLLGNMVLKSDIIIATESCLDKYNYEKYRCITFCSLHESGKARDKCYMKIATQAKNSEACSDIISEDKRDKCYLQFAFQGNPEVCPYIDDDGLRISCFSLTEMIKHSYGQENRSFALEEYVFDDW